MKLRPRMIRRTGMAVMGMVVMGMVVTGMVVTGMVVTGMVVMGMAAVASSRLRDATRYSLHQRGSDRTMEICSLALLSSI